MEANPQDIPSKPTETQTNDTEKVTEAAPVHTDDTPAMAEFRARILNRPVCVTLADERKIYGKINCIDQQKNIVIFDAVEEIPEKYVAKINEKLPILTRSFMKIKNYITLPQEVMGNEEQLKKVEEEFFKNKFYLGPAIIPGHCVTKLEIQKGL